MIKKTKPQATYWGSTLTVHIQTPTKYVTCMICQWLVGWLELNSAFNTYLGHIMPLRQDMPMDNCVTC